MQGDGNTKFFHKTIIVRRRNKVEGLQDSNGNWVWDTSDLKEMLVGYFKNFFCQ